MTTNKYKCIIAYDGTDYAGWQRQKHCTNTVTQVLEDCFFSVFGTQITIKGASRTDAGVHALCQTAVFDFQQDIPCDKMVTAWNNRLPDSIVIRSIEPAAAEFNPQHAVKQKTYQYHFYLQQPLPLTNRYGWFYRYPLDLKLLEQALNVFVGTHDFRSFCTGHDMKSTIRTIDSIIISHQAPYDAYQIEIKGPGFLRYQIRRMVGAALEVASRPSLTVDYLKQILAQKNPEHCLPNAPARGLVLKHIEYEDQK